MTTLSNLTPTLTPPYGSSATQAPAPAGSGVVSTRDSGGSVGSPRTDTAASSETFSLPLSAGAIMLLLEQAQIQFANAITATGEKDGVSAAVAQLKDLQAGLTNELNAIKQQMQKAVAAANKTEQGAIAQGTSDLIGGVAGGALGIAGGVRNDMTGAFQGGSQSVNSLMGGTGASSAASYNQQAAVDSAQAQKDGAMQGNLDQILQNALTTVGTLIDKLQSTVAAGQQAAAGAEQAAAESSSYV